MGMFPTQVALDIARRVNIHKLTTHEIGLNLAIQDFQKVATVGEFEDAVMMVEAHLTRGVLNEEQLAALEKIYNFTQIEVNGIIVDSIGAVMKDSNLEANKLHAAKLLHVIQNGEDVDKSDLNKSVKKVIFELDRD